MTPEMQKHFTYQIDLAEKHAADMEKRGKDCEKQAKEYAEAAAISRNKAEEFKKFLAPVEAPTVVGYPNFLTVEQRAAIKAKLEREFGGTVVILEGGACLYPAR